MGHDLTLTSSKKRASKLYDVTANLSTIDTQQYFRRCKSLIDDALNNYFKTKVPPVSPVLYDAMCYSVLDAGKRFRPTLTLAVGEMFGARRAPLLSFACGIELIHCYSLIHDDLPALDNDDYRRGKFSCHKRFGEAIALLAGDALLTEAFFIATDPAATRGLAGTLIARLIHEISKAAGLRGMISGQSQEFELVEHEMRADLLENLDRLKTGALITTAARVGAIIGGANRENLDRITRYADALGLAFQITDDMLDAEEISRDNRKAQANYLAVVGKAQAAERVEQLFAECLGELQSFGSSAERLRQIARYVTGRTE
jgi:geranylgeranyl diphosphate synthase type II